LNWEWSQAELLEEVREKEQRLFKFLEQKNLDGIVIGRQDNFSWITGGGESRVLWNSDMGFSYLYITPEKKICVSLVADGPRAMDEVLTPLGYQYEPLRWYQKSKEERLTELIKGKRVISDFPLEGAAFGLKDIYKLHYPLTKQEIKKCRWLGQKTEEVLTRTALAVESGMSEIEVQGILMGEYGKYDIAPSVILIGSDERAFKYRHPVPSSKKIDKYVLISPAVRKWGLHANVARAVNFGTVPEELERKYRAASTIAANCLYMCREGNYFKDILTIQKRLYKELGFEDEWKNHYQGGITGYIVSDPTLCVTDAEAVMKNQTYEWFITITGTKNDELTLYSDSGREVLSVNGIWPTEEYKVGDEVYRLPKIMER
jgi:Xaa-Pro dipeptidase